MFIVFTRSPAVFLFGVVGVGLGSLYTAPPLRLAYRLLGEITWLVSFPLTALGALVVQAPPFSIADVMAMQPALTAAIVDAMPVAMIATAGFIVLEFPDYNADRASGKIGAAVLLGKRATIVLFAAFCVLSLRLPGHSRSARIHTFRWPCYGDSTHPGHGMGGLGTGKIH